MTIPDNGARPASYTVFENGAFRRVDNAVIEEGHACIYPERQRAGHADVHAPPAGELASVPAREGFIATMADIQV